MAIIVQFLKSLRGIHFTHFIRPLVWTGVTLLFSGSLIFIGVNIQGLRLRVANAEKQVGLMQAYQDDFVSLRNTLEGLSTERSKLEVLLPTRQEVLRNIELLERLAAATGNEQVINIVETLPTEKKAPAKSGDEASSREKSSSTQAKTASTSTLPAGFDKVDYRIDLTGTFIPLMNYIQSLENQPFLTTVKSVNLRAETKPGSDRGEAVNTGNIITTIQGTFFYVKE